MYPSVPVMSIFIGDNSYTLSAAQASARRCPADFNRSIIRWYFQGPLDNNLAHKEQLPIAALSMDTFAKTADLLSIFKLVVDFVPQLLVDCLKSRCDVYPAVQEKIEERCCPSLEHRVVHKASVGYIATSGILLKLLI